MIQMPAGLRAILFLELASVLTRGSHGAAEAVLSGDGLRALADLTMISGEWAAQRPGAVRGRKEREGEGDGRGKGIDVYVHRKASRGGNRDWPCAP